MAEEEGFEPPRPFRALRFSRPPPSTTRPFLRKPQPSRYVSVPHGDNPVMVVPPSDPMLGVIPENSRESRQIRAFPALRRGRRAPVPMKRRGYVSSSLIPWFPPIPETVHVCASGTMWVDPSLPESACRSRPGLNCQVSPQLSRFSLWDKTELLFLVGWRSAPGGRVMERQFARFAFRKVMLDTRFRSRSRTEVALLFEP